MLMDYQQPIMTDGVVVMGDWVFSELPVPPQNIKETTIVLGASETKTIYITGTSDQQ